MTGPRPTVVKRAVVVLAVLFSMVPVSSAAAWHAETFSPPVPRTYIKNLSVVVGQQAWVLIVRTRNPAEIEYSGWYLDLGDDGPGRHRGAEFLLVSAPGELQLYTLPTADPSEIGELACTEVTVSPLRSGRPGEKLRVPQPCLGSPERLRASLSVSAGEDSYSWSPGPASGPFHPFVGNVARPVT